MLPKIKYYLIAALVLAACKPADKPRDQPAESDITGLDLASQIEAAAVPRSLPPIDPTVVFVQGPAVKANGEQLAVGMTLSPGDLLRTGEDASAELAFGSLATLRLFPSSELGLAAVRSGGGPDADGRRVELRLVKGAVLAKVEALAGSDEFTVLTANAAAGVRGTEFLVRADPGLTRVAVRSGRVALLPKGALLSGLLDGRDANPLAGAVVATAFALAPSAGPGQELRVGDAALAAAEAAYGALVLAGESRAALGVVWEDQADPAPLLAPPGSQARQLLDTAFAQSRPLPAGVDAQRYLDQLDRMRDPGAALPRLPAALPVELFAERRPAPAYPGVLGNTRVSDRPIAAGVTRYGDLVLVVDAGGRLHALDKQGRVLWSAGQGVGAVTALDQAIALTEPEGLVLVDGLAGAEQGRWAFDTRAGAPRYKALPVPEGVAVATPQGIAILRRENAQLIREIPIPGGIAAPLLLADRALVGITGRGSLVILDSGSSRVRAELPLGLAEDPLAPRFSGGIIIAADRQGRIAAVSPADEKILWERRLDVRLGAEPEADGERIYLWTADHFLRVLSLEDGSDRGSPLPGVDSPPLLSRGRLYWGSGKGTLVVADAATGGIFKKTAIPDAPSVRPLLIDGVLYVGTAGGRVLRVDAGGL